MPFLGGNNFLVSKSLIFRPLTNFRISHLTRSANLQSKKPIDIALSGEMVSETLQLKVAKESTAKSVLHRYLNTYLRNQRQGSANTKTRSEVRGGGKKPYTQKKTGRARRGTNRSPLIPGGAVLFGPKPRDWSISMTRNERRLAMATALQNSSEIMTVVNSFHSNEISKTKELVDMLQDLEIDHTKLTVLLICNEPNLQLKRASRNIKKLTLSNLSSLNIFDVLNADKIILEKDAFESISLYYGPKKKSEN